MSAAPGQRTIVVPDIDWVEIPGGEFVYQEGERRELPMFFMARYPVTNVQYKTFIDAGGYGNERWWQDLVRPEPQVSRWPQANRPKTNVDWYEAVAFSRWLSAQLGYEVRLPTEEQWERAARGRDGRQYPWGWRYASGHANLNETKGIVVEGDFGEWFLQQATAVGVYPQGASSEGVLDLAGNVWEWCLNGYVQLGQVGVNTVGDTRCVRGGSWSRSPREARSAQRSGDLADGRGPLLEFRLVSSASIA